jgi:hypothetical protein
VDGGLVGTLNRGGGNGYGAIYRLLDRADLPWPDATALSANPAENP